MGSVPCRFCGIRIIFTQISVNKVPVEWQRTNEVDGRDHVCVKDHLRPQKDSRLDIIKCVRCYIEEGVGICLSWRDWVEHKQVYGCTEFERWSPSWLYPERHSEKLEEKHVIEVCAKIRGVNK